MPMTNKSIMTSNHVNITSDGVTACCSLPPADMNAAGLMSPPVLTHTWWRYLTPRPEFINQSIYYTPVQILCYVSAATDTVFCPYIKVLNHCCFMKA